MKIIFFGTPDTAVPFLKELAGTEHVAGVFTQPDKPSSRGQHIQKPPVKVFAEQNNLKIFQPEKFTPETIELVKKLEPDLGVVVAYGRLIPESVYSIPKLGCFNIHFSLLPKYRGAAPVQWSLINGEKETGVTTFFLEKTLDSGPVIVQKKMEISEKDDAASLFEKLIPLGLFAMCQSISLVQEKSFKPKPQEGEPTFAHCLKKEIGQISWAMPAFKIYDLIRGTKPWPGAYTKIASGPIQGHTLKILKASLIASESGENIAHGTIKEIVKNIGFVVKCGSGFLRIEEVHPENKKLMSAWAFLQGGHYKVGDKIF
jgi:methionyl-tRNA formyltransferase